MRLALVIAVLLTTAAVAEESREQAIDAYVDAALEAGGGVEVGWRRNGLTLELWVKEVM